MIDLSALKFDALIFDCDGTLVDTAPLHFKAFQAALAEQGCVLMPDWYQERLALSRDALLDEYATSHAVDIDIKSAVRDSVFHYLSLAESSKPIPETGAIVLQYAGILPMAVASSGQRACIERSLIAANLLQHFDHVVAAEDVEHHKPHPDAFLTAASLLKINPENCIAFEDTDSGLAAIHQAGCQAVDVREFASIYSEAK